MHSLPTRARAEAWRASNSPKAPARPKPRRTLTDRQRLWLLRLVGLLALAILGAALWPDGQTRPLSYSQPEAAVTAGSQGIQL